MDVVVLSEVLSRFSLPLDKLEYQHIKSVNINAHVLIYNMFFQFCSYKYTPIILKSFKKQPETM